MAAGFCIANGAHTVSAISVFLLSKTKTDVSAFWLSRLIRTPRISQTQA